MEIIDVNTYQCEPGEPVEIKFFCIPSRSNVRIRVSLTGAGGFQDLDETETSYRFLMGNHDKIVTFQYGFINPGSCLNQIKVVTNNPPTNDDRVTARGTFPGDTDLKTFTFKI
jgi:hypothetical protein